MLHHIPTRELQDRLFAEVARVLQTGGVFIASDSMANEGLAAFHDHDTHNPVDPAAVESRLAAAGFASIEVHVTISDGRPRRTLPLDDADKEPEPMVRC